MLSPALAATLVALAEETGESTSSLVRGLLETAEPSLQRMLSLVRAAKRAKAEIGKGVGGSFDRVVDDLEDAFALAHSRTDRLVRDLVDEAEAVKGRRRAGGGAGGVGTRPAASSTPVPVTRGSGSQAGPAKGGRKGGRRG